MSIWDCLLIVFVILKLCGVIAWSWWWVLSPIWIGFLITIFLWLMVKLGEFLDG